VEVLNSSTGVGSVFYPGIPVPPTTNITGSPAFMPQGVILGQSIQINATAPPDSPCTALLSFTDTKGNAVGPSQTVTLSPGTTASLNFNPNSLTRSGRQEFVPHLAPSIPAGASGAAPACLGSAEVYIQRSGVVSTFQTSSPPVGTPSPVN
jgi:hypothetical protein